MGKDMDKAANILHLDPASASGVPETCGELLPGDEAESHEMLAVTYTQSASGWVDAYQRHVGRLPDHLSIVSVGETTRSTTPPQATASSSIPNGPDIHVVSEATDLTGIAMQMNECLDRWQKQVEPAVHRHVCFDSLTALLQFVDLERAFRFLHVLTRQVAQVGATGHYHATAAAHDDQTVATLSALFDTVKESPVDENTRFSSV